MFQTRQILILPAVIAAAFRSGAADAPAEPDAAYRAMFDKAYPPVAAPPKLEDYATTARFDQLYNEAWLEAQLKDINNDGGGVAWGTSYVMMAFNEVYNATHDAKYLRQNRRLVEGVLAATDDKLGKKLADGRSVPTWGAEKYSKTGRAVHAVHTGIICAPIFDFLQLAKKDDAFMKELGPADEAMTKQALAALAVHDAQWHDGPEAGAGYFAGATEEGFENKPLPGNWQSAMGWACWRAWETNGDKRLHERALALGRYILHRLTPSPDGAYYWPYTLPEQPVTGEAPKEAIKGEDSSHAALTMQLPFALARAGEVFDDTAMKRLAKTFLTGIAPADDGVLYSQVTGGITLDPASYVSFPSRWLRLAKYDPQVGARVTTFYLRHKATPAPLELAELIRWRAGK